MINSVAMILLTIGSYLIFYTIRKKTKLMILHPLLTSSMFIICILVIFKIDYASYKEGTEVISSLIGPATVSLAIPLYIYLSLLRKYWKTILITNIIAVFIHALMIYGFALVFNLSREMIATFIPKSVTTPIAMAVSERLGGIQELSIIIVVMTGIVGSLIAPYLFKFLGITSPVARGLSLGNSAHAIGTSRAIEYGDLEAALATLSLIITGILTVIFAPLFLEIMTL